MIETLLPNLGKLEDDLVVYIHDGSYHSRSLLAIGSDASCSFQSGTDLAEIDAFLQRHQNEWKISWISYNAKNSIEKLHSRHPDPIGFAESCFFVPKHLFSVERGSINVLKSSDQDDAKRILEAILQEDPSFPPIARTLAPRLSKEAYLADIRATQQHIQRGDIYEMNYCQEFFNEDASIHPFSTYKRLHELTRAPFSVFIKAKHSHLLCGSPERFLRKEGEQFISQPIKGTIRRGKNEAEDEALKEQLRNDEKERSENIMITDLVRNDLSKIAKANSVTVKELCEIYSFETVHQMISTVSALAKEGNTFGEILKATFPMGSMTGAPKYRAMQLIDELEHSDRGLYSGTVGYIEPNGDFDFNVVIRSLLYNSESHYLSARVGGAITALSDPEKEYEECLLKAEALFKALC